MREWPRFSKGKLARRCEAASGERLPRCTSARSSRRVVGFILLFNNLGDSKEFGRSREHSGWDTRICLEVSGSSGLLNGLDSDVVFDSSCAAVFELRSSVEYLAIAGAY